MLAYAPIEPLFTTGVTADVIAGEYWQQTPDGSILVGGCGSVAPGEDRGVWENQPTAVVQEAIEQIVPRLFPSLAPLHVIQRWAGLLDVTTDNHPIVDRVPDMPGVYVVGGFSGHGMPFGLRFGQLLTTAIQNNGELPSALTPFRLNRPTLRKWNNQERENLEPSKFDNAPG
jgi:gamma-glutamylputrescine oxidase